MKIGVAVCGDPNCRTITEAVIESDTPSFIKCSMCGQKNPVAESRRFPDGFCHQCKPKKPLDDHDWIGDAAVCPRKGK